MGAIVRFYLVSGHLLHPPSAGRVARTLRISKDQSRRPARESGAVPPRIAPSPYPSLMSLTFDGLNVATRIVVARARLPLVLAAFMRLRR